MSIKKQFYTFSIVILLIYSFPLVFLYYYLYYNISFAKIWVITCVCIIITTVVLVLKFFISTRKKKLDTLSPRLKKLQRIIRIIGLILIYSALIGCLFGLYNDFIVQIRDFISPVGLIGVYFFMIGCIGFKSKYIVSTDQ